MAIEQKQKQKNTFLNIDLRAVQRNTRVTDQDRMLCWGLLSWLAAYHRM